jgi:hypothetical protein
LLTRHQTSYSGSAGWYFRHQSIHLQITYTYRGSQFYWWRKRSTRRKTPTCHKSLTSVSVSIRIERPSMLFGLIFFYVYLPFIICSQYCPIYPLKQVHEPPLSFIPPFWQKETLA